MAEERTVRQSTKPPDRVGIWPMKRFSATDNPGTKRACWATMAMPASWLRDVVMRSMTWPRTRMVPESGV